MRVKRRKDVLNHSQSELKDLVNDVNAHVFLKTRRFHVSFHPSCLRDIKNAVLEYLDSIIRTYDDKVNGLILGYRSVKILKDVGAIFNDDSYIHLDFEAEFYVFAPAVDSVLTGIVSKSSPEYIGCLVHRVFNVAIPRPLDCKREEWCGSSITVGQEITFTVEHLDLKGRLPYIRGILLNTGALDQQTSVSGQDSVGLIGGSVPGEDNLLIEKKHKKRKREISDEEECTIEQKKRHKEERNSSEDRSVKNAQQCATAIEESEGYSYMENQPNESYEMNTTSGTTKKTKDKRVSFQEYTVVNDHSFYETLSDPQNLDTSKFENISPEKKKKKKKKKTELEESYVSEISETFDDETINSMSSSKSKKRRRSSENGNSFAVETNVIQNKDKFVSAVPEVITRSSDNEESEMVYHKKKKKKKTEVEQSSNLSPEVSATDNLSSFEADSSSSPKKKRKKKKSHSEHSYTDESHFDTSGVEILENESEYITSWSDVGAELADSLKSKLTETDTGQTKTGEEDSTISQNPDLNEPSGDAWEIPPKKKKKKKDKQDRNSLACKSHFSSSLANMEKSKDNFTDSQLLSLQSDISLPDIPKHTTVEKRKKKSKRKEQSLNEIHDEHLTLSSSENQKKNFNDNAEEDIVETNSVETQSQSASMLSLPTKKKKKKNGKKDKSEETSDSLLHKNVQEIPHLHNPPGISCDTEIRKERKNNKISEKLPDENALKERYDKLVHDLMQKIHMEGNTLSHDKSRENRVIPERNNLLNEICSSQDQDIFSGMDSEFFTSTQVEDGLKSHTEHAPSSEKKKKRKSKDKISDLPHISEVSYSSKNSSLSTADNRKEGENAKSHEEAEDLRNSIMSSILSVLGSPSSPKSRNQREHSEDGGKKSKKKKKEKEKSTRKEKKKLTDISFPKGESPRNELDPNKDKEVLTEGSEGNQNLDSGTLESSLSENLDMKVIETPMGTFNIPDVSNITLSHLSDIMHKQNAHQRSPSKAKSKKKLSGIDDKNVDDLPSNDQRKNAFTSSVDSVTKSPKSKQMSPQEVSAQSKIVLNPSTTTTVKSSIPKGKTLENKSVKSSSVNPISSGTVAEHKQNNAGSSSSDSEMDTSGDEEGVKPSVKESSIAESNSRAEIGSPAKGSLFLDGGVDKKQRREFNSSDGSSIEMLSGAKSSRSKIKRTDKSHKTVSSSNFAKHSNKSASVQSQHQLGPSDIVPLSSNPEIRCKSVNNNKSFSSPVRKKGVSSNGSPITNVPVYSNIQTSTPSNVLFSPSEGSNSPGPDLSRILDALKSPASSITQELQKQSENSPLSRLSLNSIGDNLNAEARKLLPKMPSDPSRFMKPSSSKSPDNKKKPKKKKSDKLDSRKKHKKKKEKSLHQATPDLNALTSNLLAKYLNVQSNSLKG